MFQSLNSYSLIVELYRARINGLELKPFRTSNVNLAWCKKLTSYRTMRFDNDVNLELMILIIHMVLVLLF